MKPDPAYTQSLATEKLQNFLNQIVGSSWLKVCSLVCQGLSYPKLHDLDILEDNHSIPKQWREEILHQLIGMKSHYVLGFSILQPSTIPDPKGVWGSRFRLRTLHTKMFGRLTEGIEKGSKQGYTLRQSDVAMGTSTPFVDVLSEHGGFSLLLFDCSQKFN